jgi:hypothetical protein
MAEALVERQKITINKITYWLDSLDEDSQKMLSEIRIIDSEMQRLNIQMNIAGVAKNSLLEKIDSNNTNFSVVPEVVETDEPEEKSEPDYINQ